MKWMKMKWNENLIKYVLLYYIMEKGGWKKYNYDTKDQMLYLISDNWLWVVKTVFSCFKTKFKLPFSKTKQEKGNRKWIMDEFLDSSVWIKTNKVDIYIL